MINTKRIDMLICKRKNKEIQLGIHTTKTQTKINVDFKAIFYFYLHKSIFHYIAEIIIRNEKFELMERNLCGKCRDW